MTDRSEALVRGAYEAYGRGDVAGMMEFVDPELEWTYLDPAFENPEPEPCRGRDQLQWALERQAGQGLVSTATATAGRTLWVSARTTVCMTRPGRPGHRRRAMW